MKHRYGIGVLAEDELGSWDKAESRIEVWTSSRFMAWYHEQRLGWREAIKAWRGQPYGTEFVLTEIEDVLPEQAARQ